MPKSFKFLPLLILALLGIAAAKITPLPPGPPPTPATNATVYVRWGNFITPGQPARAPRFSEFDLSGRNPKFVDHKWSPKPKLEARYEFKPRAGARQVLWVADSLLSSNMNFTVQGFSWGMYPDYAQPSQALKMSNIPGKVFVSADVNTGGYQLDIAR